MRILGTTGPPDGETLPVDPAKAVAPPRSVGDGRRVPGFEAPGTVHVGPDRQIAEIEIDRVSVELDVDLRSSAEQGGIARKTGGVIASLDRSVLHRPVADVVEEARPGIDLTRRVGVHHRLAEETI